MVGFGYLLQNFERWWGPMNVTLSFYECRFSGGDAMRWWGHWNPTLCKRVVWTFCTHRQQDEKTSGTSHLVKLSLPIYKQLVERVPTRTGKPRKMVGNFPVREKSEKFEQTGKLQTNVIYYFLVIFKNCIILLKWIKFSQSIETILEKWKKITGNV